MHRVGRRAAMMTAAIAASPLVAYAQEAAQHAQEAAASHEIHLSDFFWPVMNFAVLVGVLYYFLRGPLVNYLRDRSTTIRKDLDEAAALKSTATAQLSEIDSKLKALPGEIDALRERGRAEIAAEDARIAAAADSERARLLEQARREIDTEVRLAKRELTEHAADLAVALASDRIANERTDDDQARLVDRYLKQVKR